MIKIAEIEKIATLARLELTSQQVQEHAERLTKVIGYFEQIAKINTDGVEPLVTPTEIESYWRQDVVDQEISGEEILQSAPDKIGNLFRVPPVI